MYEEHSKKWHDITTTHVCIMIYKSFQQIIPYTHLENHVYLAGRLNDVVKATHVLMTEVLHRFDLSLHARQVVLQDSIHYVWIGPWFTSSLRFVWAELTPRTFFSMILMATFSPVRMCLPSLTFAKPPAEGLKQTYPWCPKTFPSRSISQHCGETLPEPMVS